MPRYLCVQRSLLGVGYVIAKPESLDAASEVAGACPGLVGLGSGVEAMEIRLG